MHFAEDGYNKAVSLFHDLLLCAAIAKEPPNCYAGIAVTFSQLAQRPGFKK
jgi:hypothetical protein